MKIKIIIQKLYLWKITFCDRKIYTITASIWRGVYSRTTGHCTADVSWVTLSAMKNTIVQYRPEGPRSKVGLIYEWRSWTILDESWHNKQVTPTLLLWRHHDVMATTTCVEPCRGLNWTLMTFGLFLLLTGHWQHIFGCWKTTDYISQTAKRNIRDA